MATFADATGKEWTVSITVGSLMRVRSETDIDLAAIARKPNELLTMIFEDAEAFAKVLWSLVADQVKAADLDAKIFYGRLDGPTVERAGEAILGGLIDFFPRSQVAKHLRGKLATALQEMDRTIVAELEARSTKPSSTPATAE